MRNGSTRVMVPLHGGMGFGSETLRERGITTAKRSNAVAAERREAAAQAPIVRGPAAREGLAQRSSVLAANAQPTPMRAVQETPEMPSQRSLSAADASRPVPTASASSAPLASPALGRMRAMLGVVLDVIVLVCISVLSALLTYARAGGLLGERLLSALDAAAAGALAPLLPGVRFQWAGYLLETGLTAAALLFLFQFLSVSLFYSTLGRFVLGVELAPEQRRLGDRVAMALAEVVSVGSIFAFPFVLLTPKRVPIFAWLRLVRGT